MRHLETIGFVFFLCVMRFKKIGLVLWRFNLIKRPIILALVLLPCRHCLFWELAINLFTNDVFLPCLILLLQVALRHSPLR